MATSACLDSTLASVFWRLGDGPTVATATVGVDSIGVPRAVVAAVVVGRAVESVARTWVEGGHHDGGGDDHAEAAATVMVTCTCRRRRRMRSQCAGRKCPRGHSRCHLPSS